MKDKNQLTSEQISAAKTILKNLPLKKSKDVKYQSAMRLKKDFQRTKEKGYTPKEIGKYLKEAGINIPTYIIASVLREMKISEEKTALTEASDSQGGIDQNKKSIVLP